ncbi:putative reverse transcriptase domain-containing protein [Tanacetum coccineum]
MRTRRVMVEEGCRIILGWNLDVVNVMVVSQTSQPWILMGDFNVSLNLEDYSPGSSKLNYAITDFKDCVYNIEVMDINSSGLHFTWNQNPKGGSGLLKKLDRIMGNTEFIDAFPGAYALFQPYRISDHSPVVLNIPNFPFNKPKPFKIFNFFAHKSQVRELVSSVWNVKVDGHKIYQVVSKLKALRNCFVSSYMIKMRSGIKAKATIEWLEVGFQTLPISTNSDGDSLLCMVISRLNTLEFPEFLRGFFITDCNVLVERLRNRIEDWKTSYLSFAVLYVVSFGVMGNIREGRPRLHGMTFVYLNVTGGLGLRSLDLFNMALMTTHIWNIVSNKESLWVRWIHTYKLRNRSFWDLPIKDNVSWGWLKLLQLRVLVRPFFSVKLGNGRDTSVWHDSWCSHCPLSRLISPRDIYSEGFNNQAMVADFVINNVWTWPQAWIAKAPILNLIPAPNLDENTMDCVRWRDANGVFSDFSVSRAWEAFRPRGNEVNWFRIVWFPHSIPRHSFHLWLVMRNSLKTQDKLRQWDVGINTDLNLLRCSLCNTQSDSHAHLFFECPYSSKVWKLVRHLADMELVPPILYDIVAHLQSMANKRTARSIFGKLILAASSYFVWLERNNRLFKNVKRTPEELRDVIMVTVRLKLLSFKFKNSAKIQHGHMQHGSVELIPVSGDGQSDQTAYIGKCVAREPDTRYEQLKFRAMDSSFIKVIIIQSFLDNNNGCCIGLEDEVLDKLCLLGSGNTLDKIYVGDGVHNQNKVKAMCQLGLNVTAYHVIRLISWKNYSLVWRNQLRQLVDIPEGLAAGSQREMECIKATIYVIPSMFIAVRCMSSKLFVGVHSIMIVSCLSYQTNDHSLKEAFSSFGEVTDAVKSRISRSRIDVVTNGEGMMFANDKVPDAFAALDMVRVVSNQEVKEAIFSMGDDKSPGPDGYTAAFFKEA